MASTVRQRALAPTHRDEPSKTHAYLPIAARDIGRTRLRFEPATPVDAAHPRHINLVLVGADSGRPLQALRLGC